MLNCAVIMGRLTATPELKTTTNGTSVTSFTVAVERSYANLVRKDKHTSSM